MNIMWKVSLLLIPYQIPTADMQSSIKCHQKFLFFKGNNSEFTQANQFGNIAIILKF